MYPLKNPGLHVSGSMTSVTAVSAVEKLNPSQRLRAHFQHICRGPVRKILPWGPQMTLWWSCCPSSLSLVLLHLHAHRKKQNSSHLQSHWYRGGLPLERISIRNARKFTKKGRENKNQQCFAKCNTLRPNSHSHILQGWCWLIPSCLEAMSIPSQVSKQDTQLSVLAPHLTQ